MKEKKGIKWSTCGGTLDNRAKSVQEIAAEAIRDAVMVFLFLLSARAMLHDVFRWPKFHGGLCVGIMLVAACVSMAMGLCEQWQGSRRHMGRGLVLLGGLLGFALYYFGRTAHEVFVSTGLREVIHQYIDLWNAYFGSEILFYGGIARNIPAALDFYLLLIGFVLFWAAKFLDKKIIMGILPALIFGAELMVGYAPGISGLLFMAFGMATWNMTHFKRPEFERFPGKKHIAGTVSLYSWLPVLLAVALCSGMLMYIALPYTDRVAANAGPIRKSIQNWFSGQNSEDPTEPEEPETDNHNGNSMQLSNKMPVFEGVTVMTFLMSGPAQGNIYLKEFSAGKYQDGKWEADTESFDNYFLEKGLDPAQVAKELVRREVDALKKSYGIKTLGQSVFGKSMLIRYLKYPTGRLAVPYFSELLDDERIQTLGAGYHTRIEEVSEIAVDLWVYENDYMSFLPFFENPDSPLTAWGYDDYVRQYYLDVPQEMDAVKSLAETLLSDKELLEVKSENELRLYKADLVADWMEDNTTYSLYLPNLPQGEDAVEYFLAQTKKGYCMHYASASVMLLRQMGVPARLASGYMVQQNDVYRLFTDYFTQVDDDQSHAWVEVYLDGMGWFPVEVTRGFRPADPNEPSEDDSTEPTDATEPTIEETEPEPTETMPETLPEDTLNTIPDESGIPTGDIDPTERGDRTRQALSIVCVVLLTMSGVVVVLKLRYDYRDKLWGAIRRRETSLAIWMINRRIYRRLLRTGKIVRLNLRDAGYEEILKKTYPDIPEEEWERYMELAKAAAFSKRAFSEEEVAFCYQIYRQVNPHA